MKKDKLSDFFGHINFLKKIVIINLKISFGELKIKFVGILISILESKIGGILFNIIFFIFNLPFNIYFIFIWLYNVFSNMNYIITYYYKDDFDKLKEIGFEFIKQQFEKYAIHINLITWIIIFLIKIMN
jgi:hypothetical protein